MNSKVAETIVDLKRRVPENIRDAQAGQTPQIDPYIVDGVVWEYTYDNLRRLINPNYQVGIRLKYIYLKPMVPRKYMEYHVSFYDLEMLVAADVLDPFLLFINGKMVPWSMIRVVLSHDNYFLILETGDPTWLYEFRHIENVQIMHLPNAFIYIPYPIGGPYNSRVFGFDYMGNFTTSEDPAISIMNQSKYISWYKNDTTAESKISVKAFNNPKIKLFPNNGIIFRNGLLDTQNTEITVDSTFFTFDNEAGDDIDFFVFRDSRAVENVDNLSRVNPDYIRESIDNGKDEVYNKIAEPFDAKMTRDKTYEENVNDFIKKAYEYNANLFDKTYHEYSKLSIEEYTGDDILNLTRTDGYAYIPREHSDFTDEYIIMLQNGELYKYYYACTYSPEYYKMPIQGIESDDVIEILRFKGVNNNHTTLKITNQEDYMKYDENYINDDMILFSTIPPEDCDFTYPADGLQHFPVPYHLEYNDEGAVKIILDDELYLGKTLHVAYSHQFRHYWYKVTEGSPRENEFRIDLGTKFMYCNDYTKYMVFLNGHRLSTDQYRLTLPVRSTTPFYRFEIYLTMLVTSGDRLDVIYTPSYLRDVALISEISEDGIITVPRANLTAPLSIENYMVWANGNKIPASKLINIDSTRIKINDDIGTTHTIAVTKYLPDIDELAQAFQDNQAIWDQIMSTLTIDEILHILGNSGATITDVQPSIYEGSISVRSVMLELIREKYIIEAGVDITQPFTYGYDDVDKPSSVTEGEDSGGNSMLSAADSNLEENIDNIIYPWP